MLYMLLVWTHAYARPVLVRLSSTGPILAFGADDPLPNFYARLRTRKRLSWLRRDIETVKAALVSTNHRPSTVWVHACLGTLQTQ